jgi:acyl-CoA thioesterase II
MAELPSGPNQVEHTHISTALEVEQLDVNLFRSKTLWSIPYTQGVFGGQVISQAIVSATNCVDKSYGLHSLHCYFLLSGSPAVPIIYHVERFREGRSYTTRTVKAVQNGAVIFVLMCSFHKPEPWQPSHQWPMPLNVPTPEECESDETRMARQAAQEGMDERTRNILKEFIVDRARNPIAIKTAKSHEVAADGTITYMYWMGARNLGSKYEAPFQKCILAYLSDFHFIDVGTRTLGLKRYRKGPDALSMTSTLDHSIYFYDDNFDCGDWLLYVMTSPRTASGRGVAQGRLYTRAGSLVAVTSQEGVIRADRRQPSTDAKL